MVTFNGFYFFIKLLIMFIHRFPDFAGLATCVLSHFIQFLNDDYFEFFVRQTIDLHSLGSFIGTLLVSFRVVIFA